MTKEVAQDWHRSSATVADNMTLRLGERFGDLCHWAVDQGLEFPVELSFHILGLDEFTVGFENLAQELRHPESESILADWSFNPVVHELKKFADEFAADSRLTKLYPSIGHGGGAKRNKRQFKDLASRTFLLSLIVNPLAANTDEEVFCNRRRLRIWLIGQAAIRLIDFGCVADTSVSSAARFLQADSLDSRWALIDELLSRTKKLIGSAPNSFENFTSAMENAAGVMREVKSRPKSHNEFLNAILSIASGSYHQIESRTSAKTTAIPLHLRSKPSPIDELPFESGDSTYSVIPSVSDDDEGETFSYVTEVDPTDSAAQQTLSSGSVFMQTMELAHYLPWTWDRLLPPEVQLVESWVERTLQTMDRRDRFGGVLVWAAIQLSRSLQLVERIPIGTEMTDEWSLSPDFMFLKRRSPRRHSAWRPDDVSRNLVEPFRDDLAIIVPEKVKQSLEWVIDANESGGELTLGAVWNKLSEIKLETWFNGQAEKHFPRVTSAKLAQCKGQQLFGRSGDFSFSRLLASHPRSALPGACSYATWDVKAIEKGLQLEVTKGPNEQDSLHVMGSLLAPLESVLSEEIQQATEKLEQARGRGLVFYHNVLGQYVVTALYAASGARPLRDPFESIHHFSLSRQCVYINDKNDEGLHNGRLVPLPQAAIELLALYLGHLNHLSQAIGTHRPELAEQIADMVQGPTAMPSIPLFFLLDDHLRWHSMADAADLSCSLFDWGLPNNLFRHRYAQRLLKEGVDPEVIEGWMGHAERGAASYGDYSARCWAEDAKNYRDVIEHVFRSLPFALPASLPEPPLLVLADTPPGSYREPEVFGQRARARERKKKLKAAIQQARADIELILNGRSLNEISDNELVRLSTRMLLRENHLPHPQASVRFRVFTKLMTKPEQETDSITETEPEGGDQKVRDGALASGAARQKILKKRLIKVSDERSLINPDIAASLTVYGHLQHWAELTNKSSFKAALSKSRALCLGAVLLSVEKRLGYQQLLLDVIKGDNFRLIQHKRQYFFEYSETLTSDDFVTPVQRLEVSFKVASLLAYGWGKKCGATLPAPKEITEFKGLLAIYQDNHSGHPDPSMLELVDWLCGVINQSNLADMPGIVAAALSDRAPPTSASMSDFARILHDRVIDLPGDEDQAAELPSRLPARLRDQETDKTRLQENAKTFTQLVTAALNEYEPRQSKALECDKSIQTICENYRGLISPSLILSGLWIADHARRGKAKWRKRFDAFAKNTLTTYWSLLSPAVRGLLYDVDLVGLDSDEITELCADMLEYKTLTSRYTGAFGKRLKDFFNWASRYGVASPEWDELDITSDYRSVSPGLITETEYQAAQQVIQEDGSLEVDDKRMLGFVLLLTYRFGLRAKEAINLLRRDWCEDERFHWVLVQNNQYRKLKSKPSRRAVPLLFTLSEIEQDLIDGVLARYQTIAWPETNRPILCETSDKGVPVLTSLAPRISEALIRILRSVTGNPTLVLHHCRHSFYNRIVPALFGLDSPLSNKLTDVLDYPALKRLILGEADGVSRRSAMAAGRLMGHRFPSTGLKNYCHLVTDWIDQLTPVVHQRARKLAGVVQISDLPTRPATASPEMVAALDYPAPTLGALLRTLRLVGLGQRYERAAELMKIHPNVQTQLKSVINLANNRMRFSSPTDKNVKFKGADCPNALLETVSDQAWSRMIHHAESLSEDEVLGWSGVSADYLDELSYVVSPNRQLLMYQASHFALVKHVLELFQVPSSQFKVVAKNGNEEIMSGMRGAGFDVLPDSSIRSNLDGFPVYMRDRGTNARVSDYGGLILSRSKTGTVRNSYELALVFLAVGVLIQMQCATISAA
ncbi:MULTISPECIES: hypothetical protein [Marinobacter]|jgi:integrase|uniref:hypothetical protein n=1 Tax=Marinobacter TaxID=2742 RepID=UPI00241D96E3|nr:hypothetical protein [Marinobacter nauticus]